METILALCIGLGLSAACGFRIFVPMLGLSLAAHTGHVSLASDFRWLGSDVALTALGVATALEIGAYYVPWLDHFLDTLATPASVVAGTMVTASVMTDMSPFLRWTLAVIAGGGVAAAVQTTTVVTRAASTLATGGLANPLVASAELGGALTATALSLAAPVVGIALLVVGVGLVGLSWGQRRRRSASRSREQQII
ncbi:MAG TPA: DUF4126 domain-containing protein [Verrucomicrobiales bacterium]|nr:DUF4126 domain-containing protein [Verrucomicrobiales bacterium]